MEGRDDEKLHRVNCFQILSFHHWQHTKEKKKKRKEKNSIGTDNKNSYKNVQIL